MLRKEIKNLWSTPDASDFQSFSRTMGIFLGVIALFFFGFTAYLGMPLLIIGALLLIIGQFFPSLLKPLYFVWMTLATLLGFFMTRVILGIIFYLIFTPIGLFFRISRKDPLNETINPQAESYWIKRDNKNYEPSMTEKQS